MSVGIDVYTFAHNINIKTIYIYIYIFIVSDILPKFIAHIIMSQQATNFSQLYALKNLLSTYYKYKAGSTITKDLVEESLKSLEGKVLYICTYMFIYNFSFYNIEIFKNVSMNNKF